MTCKKPVNCKKKYNPKIKCSSPSPRFGTNTDLIYWWC